MGPGQAPRGSGVNAKVGNRIDFNRMSNPSVATQITPRRCIILFGALVCAGLASTCGSKPSPSATKPGPDVWAMVDGRAIRRADVEKAYLRVAQTTPTPSEEEALTAKLSILSELIVQDLLVARAGALGLERGAASSDCASALDWRHGADDACAFRAQTFYTGRTDRHSVGRLGRAGARRVRAD